MSECGIILLGTGPSSAIPLLNHLLGDLRCRVCSEAWSNPTGPNARNNVSALILPPREGDRSDAPKNIMIDMGKTFRSMLLRVLSKRRLSNIDALILTHGHMDAIGGLDDVRELQPFTLNMTKTRTSDGEESTRSYATVKPFPVYLSQQTFDDVSRIYEYMVASKDVVTIAAKRKVAVVDFKVCAELQDMTQKPENYIRHAIDHSLIRCTPEKDQQSVRRETTLTPYERIRIRKDLNILTLPVYHGGSYVSLGLLIGSTHKLVYISDVSYIPEMSMKLVEAQLPIEVLIVDSLRIEYPHYSHFSLVEALELIKRWCPKRAYIIGMVCRYEYFEMQRLLDRWLDIVKNLQVEPDVRETLKDALKGCKLSVEIDALTRHPRARFDCEDEDSGYARPSLASIERVIFPQDGELIEIDLYS